MKISFVIDAFNGGGKERRCLQIIQGLNKAGVNDIQLIIVNNGIDYPEIYSTTAEVIVMDRKRQKKSNNQTIRDLHGHLQVFKPDIVQVWNKMSAYFVDIVILRYRQSFKYIVAYVADCNTPNWRTKDFLINKLSLFLANKVIGNSMAGLKAYSVPKKKRVCIYNGYNFERAERANSLNINKKKKELNITTPYVVSMIARVDKNKDYQTFIDCAKQILTKRKDITFLAVGKGNLLDFYTNQIPQENRNEIRFIGFRNDVDDIIKISTITLLLTNYKTHGEGISNSIMESMALGVPVIATYGGGTPEIIKDEENGYLITNNSSIEIAQKVDSIIENKSLLYKLSIESKNCIVDKFELKKNTEKYIILYKEMINSSLY